MRKSAVRSQAEAELHDARSRIAAHGAIMKPDTDLEQIKTVIRYVGGDIDVAVDAITMWPRPPWLFGLIGSDMSVIPR